MSYPVVGLVTYADQPITTVTHGGTAALAQGASEQWTVNSGASFPVASTSSTPATIFMVADSAATSEIVWVTAATTVSPWVWGVTRGAEGTSPITHASNFTVQQVVTASALQNFKQATNALTTPVTVSSSVETVVCTYQPTTAEVEAGTTFETIAFGPMQRLGGALTGNIITWRLRWGAGTAGTQILSLATGTNGPAMSSTTIAAGSSYDLNGSVTLLSSTTATGNLNFWFMNTAVVVNTYVASSNTTPTAITGDGPLTLTCQFAVPGTNMQMVAVAPLAIRIA